MEKLVSIKNEFYDKYRNLDFVVGCGIGKDHIKCYISDTEKAKSLPTEFKDIKVIYVNSGIISFH